jgi:hypothetical protein
MHDPSKVSFIIKEWSRWFTRETLNTTKRDVLHRTMEGEKKGVSVSSHSGLL